MIILFLPRLNNLGIVLRYTTPAPLLYTDSLTRGSCAIAKKCDLELKVFSGVPHEKDSNLAVFFLPSCVGSTRKKLQRNSHKNIEVPLAMVFFLPSCGCAT